MHYGFSLPMKTFIQPPSREAALTPADHAHARYPDLPPALAEHLWLDHIIPWTKQVELLHLIDP